MSLEHLVREGQARLKAEAEDKARRQLQFEEQTRNTILSALSAPTWQALGIQKSLVGVTGTFVGGVLAGDAINYHGRRIRFMARYITMAANGEAPGVALVCTCPASQDVWSLYGLEPNVTANDERVAKWVASFLGDTQ